MFTSIYCEKLLCRKIQKYKKMQVSPLSLLQNKSQPSRFCESANFSIFFHPIFASPIQAIRLFCILVYLPLLLSSYCAGWCVPGLLD